MVKLDMNAFASREEFLELALTTQMIIITKCQIKMQKVATIITFHSSLYSHPTQLPRLQTFEKIKLFRCNNSTPTYVNSL